MNSKNCFLCLCVLPRPSCLCKAQYMIKLPCISQAVVIVCVCTFGLQQMQENVTWFKALSLQA